MKLPGAYSLLTRPRSLVLAVALGLALLAPITAIRAAQPPLSTGDGGWVWQNPLPQGNPLYGVAAVNAQTVWAVGEVGTILRTFNSGVTWTSQSSGTTANLLAVAAADAQTAWAVGEEGTILIHG